MARGRLPDSLQFLSDSPRCSSLIPRNWIFLRFPLQSSAKPKHNWKIFLTSGACQSSRQFCPGLGAICCCRGNRPNTQITVNGIADKIKVQDFVAKGAKRPGSTAAADDILQEKRDSLSFRSPGPTTPEAVDGFVR